MTDNTTRIDLLARAAVPTALLKLGLPTMVGMLLSALYNAIDGYFVGGLGLAQMGAVSVVFPIVQIVIGLGMMFGAGAASYLSRLLGQGELVRANQTASTALFTSLLVGGVSIAGILCFLDPILTGLGATATILPYARAYARIYVAGSLLNVFTVTMNNLLTAQGATRFTMLSMLTGSLANVVLDPIFIYGLNLEIQGAAVATVLSLCLSAGLYLGYLLRRKGVLRFSLHAISPSKALYREILKIGVPVLLFQLLSSASMGLINTQAKRYGDYAVAAMGAVSRVMAVATYVVFGFLKGFQPFAGYNYGARQFRRLKKSIDLCLLWSTGFCLLGALVLGLFSISIVSLFGTDPEMVSLAGKALVLNGLSLIPFGFQMVYASLFLAVGKGAAGSILSLSRQGIFFFPLVALLPALFGLTGVILVQPIADLLSTLLTFLFVRKRRDTLSK